MSRGSCSAPAISTSWRLLRDRLERNADLHFVADQEAAGFERRVPVQAEVLAVDRRLAFEADAGVAPRIDRRAEVGDRQRQLFGDAADGQCAFDVELLG